MKKTNIVRKAILATTICVAMVGTAQTVYKGLRVPQLSTTDRANIGAESNPVNAKGQQIFNLSTGQMEYWDGEKWVNANVQAIGDSLVSNPTYVSIFADSIAKHFSNTDLGDTIIQYITNNFPPDLGDEIINYISNNFEEIMNLITKETNIVELGDSLALHFSKTVLGDTIKDYLLNNNEYITNLVDIIKDYLEDNNTLYTAGYGLNLDGTEFSANMREIADSLVTDNTFITNLGDELVSNETFITNLGDELVSNETFITNLGDELVSNETFITNMGDTLLTNNTFVTNMGDSIAMYISNTVLGDTIINYITNNFPTDLGDTIINYISNNFEEIINLITNETNIVELGDSLALYFSQTVLGDTIKDYLLNNNEYITNLVDVIKEYLDDNNTLYTAGYGLNLDGTEFSANMREIADSLVTDNTFITNLGDELVSNETFITNLGDELVSNETYITNLGDELVSNETFVTNMGDSIAMYISNTVLGDTIINYITNNFPTDLGDTIINYITNNFEEIINQFMKETNYVDLGDSIANYFNETKLGETILNYITNNFSTDLGDEILNYITNNVTQDLTDSIMTKVEITGTRGIKITGSGTSNIDVALPTASTNNDVLTWENGTWVAKGIGDITTSGTVTSVTSSVDGLSFGANNSTTPVLQVAGSPVEGQFLAHDGTWKTPSNTTYTADESTLTLDGNEFSVKDLGITNGKIANNAVDSTKIKDGSISLNDLRDGTAAGQIMQWDGTKWVLTSAASVVKKLEVNIGDSYTLLSANYTGETGTTAKTLDVIGIEPVITSSEGDRFIARNLTVSVTAKVVSGQILYTLRVKNENIDDGKSYSIEKLNIFYTCDDTLTAGAAPVAETYAGGH